MLHLHRLVSFLAQPCEVGTVRTGEETEAKPQAVSQGWGEVGARGGKTNQIKRRVQDYRVGHN